MLQKMQALLQDRKSTRLNSSHDQISYAVFCLKQKKQIAHAEQRARTRVRIKSRDIGAVEIELMARLTKIDVFNLGADWVNFFFNDTATTEIYTLSLHDALPI